MTASELAALLVVDSTETPTPTDWSATIGKLSVNTKALDIDTWKKQYSVDGHDVMSTTKRPDKQLEDGSQETVNRVGLSFQKLITAKAVAFLFGKPAILSAKPNGEQEKQVYEAIQKILKAAKINSHNKELALDLFRGTEVAECWYPVEGAETHNKYGFPTKFKLRVRRFSPWEGDLLFPLFDEYDDLIAFSRKYSRKEEGKEITYFETYTADHTTFWKKEGSDWALVKQSPNAIKKIPIVYGKQPDPEWKEVQNLIDRLETLLSNFADTSDYHASPTVVVEGSIQSMAKKGETGKVIEIKQGGKVFYLNLDQSPEIVRLEVENKFRLIYSLSQTPDVSFDAVKGLGDVSGVALELLFMDAHLKVEDKKLVFDAFLERRMSLLTSFIGMFNKDLATAAGTLSVDTLIQPYKIDSVQAYVEMLAAATNGQPLISQQTAVGKTGLVDDAEEEFKRIQKEAKDRQVVDLTEPTI